MGPVLPKKKARSAPDTGQTMFFQDIGGAPNKKKPKKYLYLSKIYQLQLQGYFVYSVTCKIVNFKLIKKQILVDGPANDTKMLQMTRQRQGIVVFAVCNLEFG